MDNSSGFTEALVQMLASDMPMILSLIFGGCCSNAFALEVLVTDAPKSGQLITLGQFIFVAVEGLRHQLTWGKSGGLIVNMIMGAIILGKRYSVGQIVGVVLVTAGVIWATLDNASNTTESNSGSTADFIIGITLLIIAMVLSAGMGLFQEVTYKKYGKQWREGLFYTHFLALPFFLLFSNNLIGQIHEYNKSPLMPVSKVLEQIPVLGSAASLIPTALMSILHTIEIRKLWAYLIMNVVTQYGCIAGVNRMTSVSTSLTLNLVLNLRKFTSLIISIIYFENDFGFGAKMGTVFVFFGTLIYTRAGIRSNSTTSTTMQKEKKKN
ncbi:hypothetical protein G6F57_007064 [Rhizopus arrhizus]|uniref:UDP-xylose and UDP-N-acetylglucosamine transporter n=1 Tax=Rhizopus oryzae TaxID=64495 RepID=A0A9P6X855_RHIOR|nr:hypothetical protein G6F23_009432 [Rhizopus arrhizus]KAG1422854.1 hypothetical protein G6F58_003082 [Rhizopus delemar]KAG0763223.1 hypothetical protein G6F24_006193 [Rhizopus arrhizus]KAG0789063.1 hypothetical protein G6F21_006772 [Rhizopus arrhizus]KAG0810972.1 hypothetical protein G6F20_007526 [Rhizopus arrhizus]